jgi:hypothetical protein
LAPEVRGNGMNSS